MSELSSIRRERIQNRLTKAVLSDDGVERLNSIISANELSESDAAEMLQNARRKRIDVIRGVYMRKVWVGAAVLSTGIGAVYLYLLAAGTVSKAVWLLGGIIVLMGLGLALQGVVGIIGAAQRRGSFVDYLD